MFKTTKHGSRERFNNNASVQLHFNLILSTVVVSFVLFRRLYSILDIQSEFGLRLSIILNRDFPLNSSFVINCDFSVILTKETLASFKLFRVLLNALNSYMPEKNSLVSNL